MSKKSKSGWVRFRDKTLKIIMQPSTITGIFKILAGAGVMGSEQAGELGELAGYLLMGLGAVDVVKDDSVSR